MAGIFTPGNAQPSDVRAGKIFNAGPYWSTVGTAADLAYGPDQGSPAWMLSGCNPNIAPGNYAGGGIVGRISPSFVRASIANDYLTGAQVASGVPRYDTAKFNQGIMLEEGTTNLVANPSFEIGITGWTQAGNHTIARSTYDYYVGSASALITATGAGDGGNCVYATPSISNGVQYAVSFWAQYVSGSALTLHCEPYGGSGATTVTLTTAWKRFSTIITATSNNTLYFWLNGAGSCVIDGVQVEQKAYPLSYIDTTRAAETLTVPTAGVFAKGNWTVEMIDIPTSAMNVGSENKILWDITIDANNWYHLGVSWSGQIYLRVHSGGTNYEIDDSAVLTVGTPYRIMVSGDGSHIRLCKEGAQIGADTAYVEPVGALPANMDIGCFTTNEGNSTQVNGIIDDLRISSRARTLAEHQAYVNGGVAQMLDGATTLIMNFDGVL